MSYNYYPQPKQRSPLFASFAHAPATAIIIAACVIVWVATMLIPELYSYVALSAAAGALEPWRFITSAFAHSTGLLHIGSNMFVLWMVGQQLEPLLGRGRFVGLYLLSAFGGGVAWVLLANPQSQGWYSGVVGASGAVFGLFGAVLVLQRVVGRSSRQLIGLLLINAMIAFLVPSIAWQAHVGGLVVGAACAAAMVGPIQKRKPGQASIGLIVIAVALVATLAAKYIMVGAW